MSSRDGDRALKKVPVVQCTAAIRCLNVNIVIGFCPSLDLALLHETKPIKKGFSTISFLKIISFTMLVNGSLPLISLLHGEVSLG